MRPTALALLSILSLAIVSTAPAIERLPSTPPTHPSAASTLAALPDQGWTAWRAAVTELSRPDRGTIPTLLEALASGDRAVRTAAAHALSAQAGLKDVGCRSAAAAELLTSSGAPLEERRARFARIAAHADDCVGAASVNHR